MVDRHIFDALRVAPGPLSRTEIAAYVAQHGLDMGDKHIVAAATDRIGKALGHYRREGRLVGERRGNVT